MTKRSKSSAPKSDSEEGRISELEGHLELGMKGEALKSARRLLQSKPLSARAFQSAVEAILIQADNLKPWQRVVQDAHTRLRKSDQRTVRFEMLAFSASVGDWKRAAEFVTKNPETAADLLFSMRTWVNLKDAKRAKTLEIKCERMLGDASKQAECSTLLEALASYYAYSGKPDLATKCWESSASFEPFLGEALTGLVRIQAVRAQNYVRAGLQQIQKFREADDVEQAILLPKNREGCFAVVERELQRYQKALEKIVPRGELWEFGLQPGPGEQAA